MIKTLWPHARPYGGWIAAGIACSAAEAVFELLIPLVMSDIVNIGIPAADEGYILMNGLKMALMALVSLALGVGSAVCSSVAGQGFGANLRKAQYDHIQTYAFSNIEKFSTASLITRLTGDAHALQMALTMGMRLLVRSPVMLVAALVLSMRISVRLSGVFLVTLPVLAAVVSVILVRSGPLFRSLQEKTDALNLVVQENLAGIRVVKSFVKADFEQEKFNARNRDLKATSERAFGMVVINMPVMMLIVNATLIAVIWFGGGLVNEGLLATGDLMAYFTYIMQIMMSLMMVSMMFMMMSRSVASARRIIEVLEERPAITDEAAEPEAEAVDGSIDFDHVYFRYNEKDPEWVLRDVDIHIPSGATVGVLGGTGVHDGVAAVEDLLRFQAQPIHGQQQPLRVGLVALHVSAADDELHRVGQAGTIQGALNGQAAPAADDGQLDSGGVKAAAGREYLLVSVDENARTAIIML